MNLSPVDVGAFVAAGALGLSKLFPVAQKYWTKMPRWLALAVPVLVLDFPVLASYFVDVHSSLDLVTAGVTSVALLLPGLAEAESPAPAAPAAPAAAPAVAPTAPAAAPAAS